MNVVAAVILLEASLIVLMLGYLIRAHKQLSLIAGLDVSKVRERDGLARWIGTGLLVIGMLDLLISLVVIIASAGTALLIIAYVAVNLVGAVTLLTRVRRYLSRIPCRVPGRFLGC